MKKLILLIFIYSNACIPMGIKNNFDAEIRKELMHTTIPTNAILFVNQNLLYDGGILEYEYLSQQCNKLISRADRKARKKLETFYKKQQELQELFNSLCAEIAKKLTAQTVLLLDSRTIYSNPIHDITNHVVNIMNKQYIP